MKKHWFIQDAIKERANQEDTLGWENEPDPVIPKYIKTKKPSYYRESMTFRTASYTFLKDLMP